MPAALRAEGQEKGTSFSLSAGRVRGRDRKGGGGVSRVRLSAHPAGLARPPPGAPGGRSHSTRVVGAGQAGGAVGAASARGRTQGVLQGPRLHPASPHPGGGGWARGGHGRRRPGPQGRQAAPISRASGRRGPALWSARPGARAPAIGLDAPASPPPGPRGDATPSPTAYLHRTAEESARVGRELLDVEVHHVHPAPQPGGAAG